MRLAPVPKAPYHTDDSWWHLLHDDAGVRYLLVHCEASFVSFDRLIKLNQSELKELHGLGWIFLQYLANRINYFVDDYKERSITGELLTAANNATK